MASPFNLSTHTHNKTHPLMKGVGLGLNRVMWIIVVL